MNIFQALEIDCWVERTPTSATSDTNTVITPAAAQPSTYLLLSHQGQPRLALLVKEVLTTEAEQLLKKIASALTPTFSISHNTPPAQVQILVCGKDGDIPSLADMLMQPPLKKHTWQVLKPFKSTLFS